MGFALAPGSASEGSDTAVVIESQGVRHHISFAVNPARQTPVVKHDPSPSEVNNGTSITVRWPDSPRSLIADAAMTAFSGSPTASGGSTRI